MQEVDVCIVGAGPGGALLSYLLGQKGLSVLLIEQTDQSNKSFRGEHVNEEGERILKAYGLFDEIEQRGLLRMEQIEYWQKGKLYKVINCDPTVGHLGIHVPQSHLIDVILERVVQLPNVEYSDRTKLIQLLQDDRGFYTGVEINRNGTLEQVGTKLIVGADGRFSTVRKLAQLDAPKIKHGYDVLWARIPAPAKWTPSIKMALVDGQQLSIFTQTNGFIQIGWNIAEGSFPKLRKQSFEPFVNQLVEAFPELTDTVKTHIQSWADFVLLDVFSAMADKWGQAGVVLIGDAAHTMTPTGAFGLNSSLRDAEVLAEALSAERLSKYNEINCAKGRIEEVAKLQALQREKEQQFSNQFSVLVQEMEKVMKFGFDIDDTLIDLRRYGFQLYNEKLGMDVPMSTFESIPTVEIHEAFGLTKEEGSAMWQSAMEDIYFNACPLFEGALETLQKLAAEGHEIYYITSRPKAYCARTREWMIAQGFPVKVGHFFCGMQDDEKIETIKSLDLDFYFDDKPAVLETLNDVRTKVVVVNQSYNQDVKFKRLTNWADFRAIIEE